MTNPIWRVRRPEQGVAVAAASVLGLSGCNLSELAELASPVDEGTVVLADKQSYPAPGEDAEFDPQRIPVEMQAWWMPDYGHIHAAVRVPLGQRVRGILEVDVRIVMHHNPSQLNELRFDTDQGVFLRVPLDEFCPPHSGDGTCAYSVPVRLDTRDMTDGWRELRVRATTDTPDGKRFLNSSGIQLFVDNGGPRDDYDREIDNQGLIGRGWYEDFGYTNAWIGNIPIEKVRGEYTFMVRSQKESEHLTVALDKTHDIAAAGSWPAQPASPGTILYDADGQHDDFFPITVDTRQLANGWHTLAVTSRGPHGSVSECNGCSGEINKPAGVAKCWFYVSN